MTRISGNGNIIHTYEVYFRDDIIEKKGRVIEKNEIFTQLVNILSKNKVRNLSDITKGFVPFQFERGVPINITEPIENSNVRNMLVVTHYEKKKMSKKKMSNNLQKDYEGILNSPDVSEDMKHVLENFFEDSYFLTFVQDFIFIQGDRMTLLFPANDRDNVVKYNLNPYFENLFEFNLDPIVRKITQDLLKWLVWKVKRYDDGYLDESLQIEEVQMYDSSAHFNSGELKIKFEGIEDNIYAMLSMASDERCQSLELTVIFLENKFHFVLFPEGGYIPVWKDISLKEDENNNSNRVLILEKISKEIIPHIYKCYQENLEEWNSIKPQIQDEIMGEVKQNLN